MKQNYKGLIFTNHALERMREREIRQKDAWATWYNPDSKKFAKTQNTWVYYKHLNNYKIKVVAKRNSDNNWVVLSIWSTVNNKKPSSTLINLFKKYFNSL